jgi:hypothetical protein
VLGGRLEELNAFEGSLVAFAIISGIIATGILIGRRGR